MEEQIKEIMKEAIEELNSQLDDDKQLKYGEEVYLIGKKALIDSMEFVTLIAVIEELISDKFNIIIQIVSDKAFSRERSPFYSVQSLEAFILELVKEV